MTFEKMNTKVFSEHTNAKYPTGSVEIQAPVFEQARNTLQQANAIATRIMELADRLCGPVPTTGGCAITDRPGHPGAFDRFRAEMRDTRQALIFADDALTRIEQELIG